jgi:photosystem II stability/assembly factor-like uncharacterized protein
MTHRPYTIGGDMKLDRYDKTILTLIAFGLLLLALRTPLRVAHADSIGKLNFAKDGGVSIACSADGKHVFVAGNEGVIVSEDYGRLGSWQKTILDD